jgi:hypothetical protein
MRPLCLARPLRLISFSVLAILLIACANFAYAENCPPSGMLLPGGSPTTDLVINTPCRVVGLPGGVGVYVFHNVNVVAGGTLTFEDTRIDFHAESIIVENGGKLEAGTILHPIGMNPAIPNEVGARVRIYLWGKQSHDGALCVQDVCGVPNDPNNSLWSSNTTLAMHMVPHPKNAACKKASEIDPKYKLPGDDCFYQYDTLDDADAKNNLAAYFGHKVLALSYGGTLQLFGVKGATYDPALDAKPEETGTSWVRLAELSVDRKTLTLSAPVGTWKPGDHILVTTTDYLPTHNEERVIQTVDGSKVVLTEALEFPHNATVYSLPSNTPPSIGPRGSRTIETRAAVALLTRSIAVASEGDEPDTDISQHDHFPPSAGYFGGHTIVRQGFKNFQVKGVEYYQLGEGGVIGHYPVHFHMARKTPQPEDATEQPYLRDCSIHDSMTRWITVHATQGMTIARNVGYLSIGHGFYLEDATEVNNKIYTNLGASVIAAVHSASLNPRDVPGILARPDGPPTGELMPYRSDWNHPSAFWIMNGWNDFQYNMAAGVTSCGACYWIVPGADSGPSMFEVWDGYASEGLNLADGSKYRTSNRGRGGLTPVKNFVGNSCVASQLSLMTIGDSYDCLGFTNDKTGDLSMVAVRNDLAPPLVEPPTEAYTVYYPQVNGSANPTVCPSESGDCSTAPPCANTGPNRDKCMVTTFDRYTTSFNYAQTNFAAIWMRAKWFLFTDGAVTDSQYGGLNFTTGGGYTHSDSPFGNWMLAYRTAFIGTSQPVSGNNHQPSNAYASNAGPFNPTTGMTCSNATNFGYCLSEKDAITFQINPFPGQRMFSVYDGPAFQSSNAYLSIYPTTMSVSDSSKWMYLSRASGGVLKADASTCYLPNAAIGWKQPNGFYYPPAFHSQNLMFQTSNIRHFVVEPLFEPGVWPPQGDAGEIRARYCPGSDSPALFQNFTDIDRQTVLNDGVPDRLESILVTIPGGDGSLTGLVGAQTRPDNAPKRETISINEDPFFNAPLETVECASDRHMSDQDGKGAPGSAKTSPYEWLTTAMVADCAIGYHACENNPKDLCPNECLEGGQAYWTHQGATPDTFGVPLYRQYLTKDELGQVDTVRPRILMLGQGNGQRSTLTINHGHYYIDTSYDCANQGGCIAPPVGQHGNSVFLGGHSYYVYFVYGRQSTRMTFDIYLGPKDETGNWKVSGVRGIFDTDTFKFDNFELADAPWIEPPSYNEDNHTLTVGVDLSKSSIAHEFDSELKDSCAPSTYCEVKTDVIGRKTCGCKAGSGCKDDVVCSWGPKDPDCPETGCYGFVFTMPDDFVAPAQPVLPPAAEPFTKDSYFNADNVIFKAVDVIQFGQDSQCDYRSKR